MGKAGNTFVSYILPPCLRPESSHIFSFSMEELRRRLRFKSALVKVSRTKTNINDVGQIRKKMGPVGQDLILCLCQDAITGRAVLPKSTWNKRNVNAVKA